MIPRVHRLPADTIPARARQLGCTGRRRQDFNIDAGTVNVLQALIVIPYRQWGVRPERELPAVLVLPEVDGIRIDMLHRLEEFSGKGVAVKVDFVHD